MLRVLLQYLLPLLLPFLLYLVYVAFARGYAPGWIGETPWPQLAAAGLVLLAASLLTWSLMSGAPTDRVYVPPRLEDGKVIPSTTVEP